MRTWKVHLPVLVVVWAMALVLLTVALFIGIDLCIAEVLSACK